MSTQISEDSVNTVKERLKDFLGYIKTYSVDQTQPVFYSHIRSCVALFWLRRTYDYGPNGSGETWPEQKQMPHEEAIQKIKQEVIPLLKKAKSHLVENSAYVPEFEKLHSYISAFFPEKQAVRTEQTGRTQKMLQLLDELRRLVDQSDV